MDLHSIKATAPFSLLPGHCSKVTFNTKHPAQKLPPAILTQPPSHCKHNLRFTANRKLTIGSPRLYALTRTSTAPSDQRICAGQRPFLRDHC